MARKTPGGLGPEEQDQVQKIGEQLRLFGVKEKEPNQEGPVHTPSTLDKSYWSERGRARDLQVEKDGHTEAIRSHKTDWNDRLKNLLASRAQEAQAEQGSPSGKTSELPEAQRADAPRGAEQGELVAERTKAKSVGASKKQKSTFQDRVREQGGGKTNTGEVQELQGKASGQEREHEW